jgi:hypothetical protein
MFNGDFLSVFRIQIQTGFNWVSGIRIREGKSDPQKRKKEKIFHGLMSWTFSLRKWKFPFVLGNPSWRPKET